MRCCQRRDVIIVASVSCIYGIDHPAITTICLSALKQGATPARQVVRQLTDIQYQRNDTDFHRAPSVRGDVVDIYPAERSWPTVQISLVMRIERITQIDPLTGRFYASQTA